MTKEEFIGELEELIEDSGLTQPKFAAKVGMPYGTLVQWRQGKGPSAKKRESILDNLKHPEFLSIEDTVDSEFPIKLKSLIAKLRLTYAQIGNHIGHDKSRVYEWVNSKKICRHPQRVLRILERLLEEKLKEPPTCISVPHILTQEEKGLIFLNQSILRFFSYIEYSSQGCWICNTGKTKDGYGKLYFLGRHRTMHCVSWEIFNQEKIPEGLLVLHSCDTPACVNPDHLRVGTQQDNSNDMVERGRSVKGRCSPRKGVKLGNRSPALFDSSSAGPC